MSVANGTVLSGVLPAAPGAVEGDQATMWMGRINQGQVVVVVASTLMIGVAGLAAHRVQIERTARRELARAEADHAEGRIAEAVERLGRYVALKPSDRSARIRHALLSDQTAITPQAKARAIQTLEDVLRRNPGRADVRMALAARSLDLGKVSEARTYLRILSREYSHDPSVAELAGRCDEASGDFKGASRWYEFVLASEPSRIVSALGLAGLRRGRLRDPEGADRVMDGLVSNAPRFARAWLARSRYRRAYAISGADDDLTRARMLAPDDAEVLLEIAKGKNPRQTERQALERGRKLYPTDPRFCRELAVMDVSEGHVDKAIERLRDGIDGVPDAPDLCWTLANLLAERGDTVELTTLVKRLRNSATRYPSAAIDFLGARLAYNHKEYAVAAKMLERSKEGLSPWPDLEARARALLEHCGENRRRNEQSTDPRLAQVAARINQNTAKVADDQNWTDVDHLLNTMRNVPGAIALQAESIAVRGQVPEALVLLRERVSKQPDDPEALRDWARFVLRHGPREEVASALRSINATEDVAWARRVLALWLVNTGARVEARRVIDRLGEGDPEDLRARARVLAALGGLRDRREAVALLERAGLEGDDRVLLAMLYESIGDWPRARSLIDELTNMSKSSLAPDSLAKLVEALVRHDLPDLANAYVKRLEQVDPGTFREAAARARLLRASGKPTAAAAVLIRHTEDRPEETEVAAALLESFGYKGPAESLFRTALARPNAPRARLALASFLGRQRRGTEAFGLCEKAWSQCPADDVATTLVGILDDTHLPSAVVDLAAIAIESALGKEPESASLRVSLATVRELQGRFDDAERLDREALDRDSGNAIALNNLSVLIALRGGDRTEAIELIDRAIERAGPRPDFLDTRALVRIASGDASGALEDASEAVNGLHSSAAYFHLAQAYLQTRNRTAAVAAYKKIGVSRPDDRTIHPLERPAFDRIVADLRLNKDF